MNTIRGTVLSIFYERKLVEGAIMELLRLGYDPKDMSVVMRDERSTGEDDKPAINSSSLLATAATGASTGAVLGGAAGLLSLTLFPGLTTFFIGGSVASVLGLTGAAATTVSGALTGAVAGWLLGALIQSLETTWLDYQFDSTEVSGRGIMLAVPAHEGEENIVKKVLKNNGGDKVVVLKHGVSIHKNVFVQPAYFNEVRRTGKKSLKKPGP